MSKEWFIKEGGQVCFKSENCELNGWDTQSLVDCLKGKEIKIADLEAKLADKEEEIKQLNNIILISQLQAPKEQILNIIGNSCCQYNPKQDKILFALEKLEKVKEFFLEEHRDEEMDTDYIITKDACQIAEYLLDQIKQLKEMK